MVNQSKANDARFCKKWKNAGATSIIKSTYTIPFPRFRVLSARAIFKKYARGLYDIMIENAKNSNQLNFNLRHGCADRIGLISDIEIGVESTASGKELGTLIIQVGRHPGLPGMVYSASYSGKLSPKGEDTNMEYCIAKDEKDVVRGPYDSPEFCRTDSHTNIPFPFRFTEKPIAA